VIDPATLTLREMKWVSEQIDIARRWLEKNDAIPPVCMLGNIEKKILVALSDSTEDHLTSQVGLRRARIMSDLLQADILAMWKVLSEDVFLVIHASKIQSAYSAPVIRHIGGNRTFRPKDLEPVTYDAYKILSLHRLLTPFADLSEKVRLKALHTLEEGLPLQVLVHKAFADGESIGRASCTVRGKPSSFSICYDLINSPILNLRRACEAVLEDYALFRLPVTSRFVYVHIAPLSPDDVDEMVDCAASFGLDLAVLDGLAVADILRDDPTLSGMIPDRLRDNIRVATGQGVPDDVLALFRAKRTTDVWN